MAALARIGWADWVVVTISAILFGLAHAYQGKSGVIGTALLGLLFGFARVLTLSLIPVVVWHSAVDLVAGVAGPRFLQHEKTT